MSAPEVAIAVMSDRLWAKLGSEERAIVAAWQTIAARLSAAEDKGLELARVRRDFAGLLRGLSRGSIYRKLDGLARLGSAGVLSKAQLRRLGEGTGASRLPEAFIRYWKGLCGFDQRMKALEVWKRLMRRLISGAIIPGYDTDWRGIWLSEHPGWIVPARCPYVVDHRVNLHPKGWSYRNLKDLAPERDVWTMATQGVAAGRAFLPSVPHTRVGLDVMEVITMDDVWHDCEVLFLAGPKRPTHERPVEIGALDVLTGAHIAWNVWPVMRRDDGGRTMVDWTVQRFIQAQIFCGIGISPRGLTELLEHGTAGMSDEEVKHINTILERYLEPPAGRRWLEVLRSSTTGAPVCKGLYTESHAGNPRHKAMLESTWNLLHNELAALPAQVGKDRDHAPAEQEGLRKEDREMMAALAKVAERNPKAIETLRSAARFHAASFADFCAALREVKEAINTRVDHTLQDWEACGFTHRMLALPGGVEVDLDGLTAAEAEELAPLVRSRTQHVRLRRMSPAEAFAASAARTKLIRFPMACAMEILGDSLAQAVKVADRGTLSVTDRFSREKLVYSAVLTSPEGRAIELTRGATVKVWANPFARELLLVADQAGHALGAAKRFVPARFADPEGDLANLGLWQSAKAAQAERLAEVEAGKVGRAEAVRKDHAALLQRIESETAAAEAEAQKPKAKPRKRERVSLNDFC